MNNVIQFIIIFFNSFEDTDILTVIFKSLDSLIQNIDWVDIIRVFSVLLFSVALVNILFLLNDKIYDYYGRRRMRIHHLTVTNNGNTPSIFLFRTMDMPKNLVLRFRVKNQPMIWVTYAPEKSEEKAEAEAAPVTPPETEDDERQDTLIPNLNDPLKKTQTKADAGAGQAVKATTKSLAEIGKKAGFFASIFGSIATLLPKKIGFVNEAQSSLKNLQQQTTQLTGEINTKVNAVNSLGKQLGQLPMADQVSAAAQSAGISKDNLQQQAGEMAKSLMNSPENAIRVLGGDNEKGSYLSKDFVYDESVWEKNIGKVDNMNGSLNFAQSKILDPGESMKIDLEIMNLSESPAAVSELYKIEVRQVMISRLHLTAPRQYINGVVIFEKTNQLERLLPSFINVALVIVAIQLGAFFASIIF